MSIPVFIQAVPWWPARTKNAIALAQATGGTVIWDEHQSGYLTYLKVLEAVGDSPAVILEDDVELSAHFDDIVDEAVDSRGDSVINFFSYRWKRGGWRRGNTYTANVCHYLPEGAAASLLEGAEQWNSTRTWRLPDQDMMIRDWLVAGARDYWFHVPNPVQHLTFPSVTADYRSLNRTSPTFGAAS